MSNAYTYGNPFVGYSSGAGSVAKQSMAGFFAQSESALADHASREVMASRARILDMSSPIARAAIDCLTRGVLGSGLEYAPLAASKHFEHYDALTAEIGDRLDMASGLHLLDATGRLTFGELQAAAFRNAIVSGDAFLIRRKRGSVASWRLVESRCVFTPPWMERSPRNGLLALYHGRYIVDGIELSKHLTPRAVWVCYQPDFQADASAWQRVPMYDSKGLPVVLQFGMLDRADQYRGVSVLAPLIETIYTTQAYSEAELQAALFDSCHVAFVTSQAQNVTLDPLAGLSQAALDAPLPGAPKDEGTSFEIDPLGLNSARSSWYSGALQSADYLTPGTSIRLKDGEQVQFPSPVHPNSGFIGYVEEQVKLVGAALRIPSEALLMAFNASYSASKAAIAQMESTCAVYRTRFVESVLKPMMHVFAACAFEDMGVQPEVTAEKAPLFAMESVFRKREIALHLDEQKSLSYWTEAWKAGFVSKNEAANALFSHDAFDQSAPAPEAPAAATPQEADNGNT